MNYIIRKAVPTDSAEILPLTIEGIQDWAAPVLSRVRLWMNEVCTLDYLQKRAVDPAYHVFVAVHDEEIIGTIYLNTSNEVNSYFGGWYCKYKKQGIGSALMKHVLNYAVELGCQSIECEVYAENPASIALMEKFGARQTSSLDYDEVPYLVYTFTLAENLKISRTRI